MLLAVTIIHRTTQGKILRPSLIPTRNMGHHTLPLLPAVVVPHTKNIPLNVVNKFTNQYSHRAVHKLHHMNVKLQRSYRSKNGNVTFVYAVSGTASELKAYADAQGEFHRTDKDTNEPLWFTTRCIGDSGKLIVSSEGKVYPDMSEFDQLASIVEQYGGNLGDHLAATAAAKLLGGKSAPAIAPVEQTVATKSKL